MQRLVRERLRMQAALLEVPLVSVPPSRTAAAEISRETAVSFALVATRVLRGLAAVTSLKLPAPSATLVTHVEGARRCVVDA
jgi:hypothetical protein